MNRDLTTTLLDWKRNHHDYPLLIRGARQVGKSYLVETFGKKAFQHVVVANFEFQPQLKSCFTSFDPREIVNKLRLLLGEAIEMERTLLFLDEIQECPSAISSLRYFKEKMPELPVIGAGSLLEFALQETEFKIPVGRIRFLYMKPLSFSEFLEASENKLLRDYLANLQVTDNVDEAIHEKLLTLLRQYLILGGMPAVLKEYFETQDIAKSQTIQTSLLQTYRSDFAKYARTTQHKYLQSVFETAPRLVGQRIKYAKIDPESKSQDIKNAIASLSLARVLQPVYATSASGLPLGAQVNEKKLKLNFLDVGLMQNACGLQNEIPFSNNLLQINRGALAEQFVGQELSAYQGESTPSQLFFWSRDKRNSSAEVDYVIQAGSHIIPVEVKAGKTGSLKSLHIFLQEKKAPLAIRISQDPLHYHAPILSVPLYLIEQLERLVLMILG